MNNDQAQQHDDMEARIDAGVEAERAELNHETIDETYERVTESSQQPSPEDLEEIAAREDAEWAKADQAERMAIAQRCKPTQEEIDEMAEESARLNAERAEQDATVERTQEEIDMMGSAHQPYRCEDDLPADVFATVQTALKGRGTLTSLEQIALMKAMTAHGITLKRLEYPTPTAPYFALMLVSTHSRPFSGWYLY